MAEKKTTKKTATKKPATKKTAAKKTTVKKATTKKTAPTQEEKGLAAVAYIGVLFVLPLLMKPDSEYVQFHVKQSIVMFGLELVAIGLMATIIFSALTPVVLFIALLGSGYGFISALNGKEAKIPGAEWVIKKLNI